MRRDVDVLFQVGRCVTHSSGLAYHLKRVIRREYEKSILICILTMLVFGSGCAGRYLSPISNCQPLSAYKTIVITPIDGDSALVEESKYKHLPHDIAQALTERLKDQIEFYYLFPKVVQSSECVDQAIKLEGRIYTLDHNKRSFHLGIRGRIIDCQSNKPLYIFDHDEEDTESGKLPGQIADKLFEGIKGRLTCP